MSLPVQLLVATGSVITAAASVIAIEKAIVVVVIVVVTTTPARSKEPADGLHNEKHRRSQRDARADGVPVSGQLPG
jgi:hypothetical protein